ncbi:hypothetical protein LCGC14_1889290, partial [marine sediment metagenome]
LGMETWKIKTNKIMKFINFQIKLSVFISIKVMYLSFLYLMNDMFLYWTC